MPSGRGPATPIGIGVTGSSGVNIVAKSPYRFSLSLGETPLRGFSPRSTLCILCMQSVLKAPLFKKLFIFFRLRQHFERLWGQSGELLGPGRRKRRRRLSPQIRKWWISFFKVGAEGEVAHQGVWPPCPVSPLLSPLLIFFFLLL